MPPRGGEKDLYYEALNLTKETGIGFSYHRDEGEGAIFSMKNAVFKGTVFEAPRRPKTNTTKNRTPKTAPI